MSIFSPPDPSNIQQQAIQTGQKIGQEQTAANTGAQRSSQYDTSGLGGGVHFAQIGTGPNGTPIYGETSYASEASAPSWANMFAGKALAGSTANQLLGNADYGSSNPADAIGNMSSGLAGQRMNSWLGSQMPFFQTSRAQLDAQLKNQGHEEGSEAYNNAMRQLDINQGLAVGNSASQFADQAWNQGAQAYQMPLTMADKLQQWGTPVDPNTGTFQGPAMQPADYTSATAVGMKGATDTYNAQMGQYSGLLKGVGNIAGAGVDAAFMFSDERVKENVDEVGSLHDGTPVYKYNYIGDNMPRIGLMAQDVEKVRPDAVKEFGGIKAVNYDKATARSRAMKALLA
jgi:hypothetical protein